MDSYIYKDKLSIQRRERKEANMKADTQTKMFHKYCTFHRIFIQSFISEVEANMLRVSDLRTDGWTYGQSELLKQLRCFIKNLF